MVCNNILFLILTRNTLSALLLLIPGSTVFFIGKKIWANVLVKV